MGQVQENSAVQGPNSNHSKNQKASQPSETIEAIVEQSLKKLHEGSDKGKMAASGLIHSELEKVHGNAREVSEMARHFRSSTVFRGTANRWKPTTSVLLRDLVKQLLHAMQYTFSLEKMTIVKTIPAQMTMPSIPREHFEAIVFHLLYFVRHEIGDENGVLHLEGAVRMNDASGRDYSEIIISWNKGETPLMDLEPMLEPWYEGPEMENASRFDLLVARQLIDYHRATLEVEHEPLRNAFIIRFPR